MTAQKRTLAEDLQSIGLGSTSMISLSGLEAPAQEIVQAAHNGNNDDAPAFTGKTVDEAVEVLYGYFRPQITEEDIDYTVAEGGVKKFEEDFRASLKVALEKETAGGADLTEAYKRIFRLSGSTLKRAKIRKLRGSERLAGVKYRRAHKASIRLGGAIRRRKASFKRHMKKYLKAKSRMEGVDVADKLRGLLAESESVAVGTIGAVTEQMIDTYDQIARCSIMLANFFEAYGTGKDAEIATVMDEMVTQIEARQDGLLKGTFKSDSEPVVIQKYVGALSGALERYGMYEMVEVAEDEEADPS